MGYLSAVNLPDSLIVDKSYIDTGLTYKTGYFTAFQRYYFQSFIEDDNGFLHISYIDNYELYYYKSTDNGLSWTGEKVVTGHEGDIYSAALTVDEAGYVYFGITVHPLFNYCNPTSVGSGTEFQYDIYCVNNKTGSWTSELIYTHSASNYGARVALLYTDTGNNIHLIANYYGWYSQGGTVWEWIRDASSNIWSSQKTIVTFTDGGTDRFIYDNFVFLHDSQDKKILILSRLKQKPSTNWNYYPLFYLTNSDSVWSSPVVIQDSIASLSTFYAALDPDDHVYVAYLFSSTPGKPELKISKDFAASQSANINLAPDDSLTSVRILCNADGLLTMTLYRKNKNPSFSFSTDGFNWTNPVESDSSDRLYWGGIMPRTNTVNSKFPEYCKHLNSIPGPHTTQPYGPDTLIFGSIRLIPMASAPSLYSPENAVSIDTTSAEFSRSTCYPQVIKYWFEISDNAEFNLSFIDSTLTDTLFLYNNLQYNKTYYWRVKGANVRGWGPFSETFTISTILVGVNNIIPLEYALYQNYPNPFNPVTIIDYSIKERTQVYISIINIIGEEAAVLVNSEKESGYYRINFDASNLPSGVYFYRLKAGDFIQSKKMILMK